MISIVLSYGQSFVSSFFSVRPEMVKDYIKDSGKYAVYSLLRFPPDPFPLIVLICAIFTTISAIGHFLQRGVPGIKQWVLLVGAWSGHHAMLKIEMREELKKTVNLLSSQLDRTHEQLNRWESITQKEEGKIEVLQETSGEISDVANGLKEIAQTFTMLIQIQREVSQEYVNLAMQMEEGREQAQKFFQEHKDRMRQIEQGLDKRIQLMQQHQEAQLKNITLLQELFQRIKEHINKKQREGNA